MVATNVFSWADEDGTVHVLTADLVQSSTDVRETQLTQHAVESGASISDHVIRKQDSTTFELIQAETPIELNPEDKGAFELRAQSITSSTVPPKRGLLAIQFPPSTQSIRTGSKGVREYSFMDFSASEPQFRIRNMHDRLIELLDKSYTVDIAFRGYTLSQMVLTGLTSHSNPGELGIGRFTLKFDKLNTVTTLKGDNLPDPNSGRLKAIKKQQADDAKKRDADSGRTLLSRAAEGLGFEIEDAGLQ